MTTTDPMPRGLLLPAGVPAAAAMSMSDPVTSAFGAFGPSAGGPADWSTGSLRGLPALDAMWRDLDLHGVLADIGSYPGTQGTPAYLEAAADLAGREWGVTVAAERIIAVHGAFDGLTHALAGLPSRGAVLVPTPGFDVRVPIRRAGCVPVPVRWRLGAGVGELVAALREMVPRLRPAAVVVNLPRNPDGVSATPAEWTQLLELTQRWGVRLVLDDVYSFTDRQRPPELLQAADVMVVESVSKRLGAPGLRAGFVIAPAALMPDVRASTACTVGLARPVAHIVERALREYLGTGLDIAVRTELVRRSAAFEAAVGPGVRPSLLTRPGALYAVVRVAEENLALAVLLAEDLRVTPGRALAVDEVASDPFVRVCLGAGPDVETVGRAISRAWPVIAPYPATAPVRNGAGS